MSWGVKVVNDSTWLNKDEFWKYGMTCTVELKRYPEQIYYDDGKYKLKWLNLNYDIQFVGNEKACKIEEKKKIYNYPLLPECIKRKRKLIRPPENKNDN